MPPSSFHVSRNRLEGSLCDTPISSLLESCRKHQITGTINIDTPYKKGVIELRAGWVDEAWFGDLAGDQAVRRLKRLGDGMYTLTQQLPDLSGSLGGAAQGEGDLSQVSLVTIMRHCEDQALSCTITIVRGFDRAEVVYRVGDLAEVTLNGTRDDDAIVDVVNWPEGRFRISAPPLALDIDGWPTATDPTAPFRIEHAARLRPPTRAARGTPAPLPGIALTPAAPDAEIEPEKTTVDDRPPAFFDDHDAEPVAEDDIEAESPLAARARITIPGMPLVAQPLVDPDARRGGSRLLTAFLVLMCVAVITAWIGAIYYIQ